MKLILLVGPPGSGKSTLAQSYSGFRIINQDDQGGEHINLFRECLFLKVPVVVDRMNFSAEQRARYLNPTQEAGYETEIVVVHESKQTCMDRCVARIGHPTIKDAKTASKAINFFFQKYERVSDDEANTVTRRYPPGKKEPAIIVDLDGTLCNLDHRLHFVQGEKRDWKSTEGLLWSG